MSADPPFNPDDIRALIIDASTDFNGFDQPRFLNHVRRITGPLFAEIERLATERDRIRDVRRLALKPGDTLALEVDDRLTRQAWDQLAAQLKEALPGHPVLIIERARFVVVEKPADAP